MTQSNQNRQRVDTRQGVSQEPRTGQIGSGPNQGHRPGPKTDQEQLLELLSKRSHGDRNYLNQLEEVAGSVNTKLALLPKHSNEWYSYVRMSTASERVLRAVRLLLATVETEAMLINLPENPETEDRVTEQTPSETITEVVNAVTDAVVPEVKSP